MEIQGKQCVLLVSLFLPCLTRNSLLCNFSTLQFKDKPFFNVTTECLLHQSCFTSRGLPGSEHMYSALGCSCCGTFQPNLPPSPDTPLRRLLGLTEDPPPRPLDPCPTPAAS